MVGERDGMHSCQVGATASLVAQLLVCRPRSPKLVPPPTSYRSRGQVRGSPRVSSFLTIFGAKQLFSSSPPRRCCAHVWAQIQSTLTQTADAVMEGSSWIHFSSSASNSSSQPLSDCRMSDTCIQTCGRKREGRIMLAHPCTMLTRPLEPLHQILCPMPLLCLALHGFVLVRVHAYTFAPSHT